MTTVDGMNPEDWYRGFRRWETGEFGVRAVRPYVTEMIGAGTVAADSEEKEWMPPYNPAFDVVGDGVRGDVKRAFHRKHGYISFGEVPEAGIFDPATVDEIVLVWLAGDDVSVEHHEYRPDGTVAVTVVGTPTAVWRVPVEAMNCLMQVTGIKPKWGNVTPEQIAPYLVRGVWPLN